MTNSEPTKAARNEVFLLADEPADTDEFDAKAHAAVAKAIRDLVQTEPGGRVIGLEGSWGSGKSTVVRLLSQQLEQPQTTAETRVLVFDAWAHQGDPLRRTFLESLLAMLERVDWLDRRPATKFHETLTGSTTRIETRATARLSLEGKLASAAAVLLPVGAALFSNDFSTLHRLALFVGFAFLLGPLLVVLGFLAAKMLGVALTHRKQTSPWMQRLADIRPFSFFANEQQTETVSEGVQTTEPTSVEFERIFSDVLDVAIRNGRRLLIVLDNLDRVAEADAKSILATMQTFTGSPQNKQWTSHVWTLIPYDVSGLDRLWANPATREGEPTDPTRSNLTAAAFIEKVFQVRFEAPPLVLSDWRGYLLRLLGRAFPSFKADEFQAVLRVRAQYPAANPDGLVGREAPTPRQLKQFVNQIGALRRQHAGVSLRHLAYYCLLRRDRIDVAAGLLSGKVPHDVVSPLFGATVADDLAAVHFGTDQELAQQLLLGGALDRAFSGGDSETVKQLSERAGFADVLDSIDWASRGASGGIELTRALAALDQASALVLPSADKWLPSLLATARAVPIWVLSGRATGAGLAVLFERLSAGDDDALGQLLLKVQQTPQEADTDGRLQVEAAAGLADGLLASGRRPEAVSIRLAIPRERLVVSLAQFASHTSTEASWATVDPGLPPDEIANSLVEAAIAGDLTGVEQALHVLLAGREHIDFALAAAGCADWLRGPDPTSSTQLGAVLAVLDRARGGLEADVVLDALVDDGTLLHMVSLATRSGWYTEAAAAQMLHLLVRPELPAAPANREAVEGHQIAMQSLDDLTAYPELVAAQAEWLFAHRTAALDLILRLYESSARPTWVDEQLRKLDAASALAVAPEQYLEYWRTLQRALGDRFPSVTTSVLEDADGRTKFIEGSVDPAFALTVLHATETESAFAYGGELKAWAAKILTGSATSDWEEGLGKPSGSPLLELALAIAESPEAPSSLPSLSSAIHAHYQALAASEPAWQPDEQTFVRLASMLGQPARKAIASQLCADLEAKDGVVSSGLFATYGAFLDGERAFRTHQKLPYFVARAVANDQWSSVEWIVAVARRHPDTLKPTGRKDEIEHLKESVSEKIAELSADEAEAPAALQELAGLLA